MGIHNVKLPDKFSYGASGGPGYRTLITEVDSGAEESISTWASARHQFDISYGVQDFDDLSELLAFFHARGGARNFFRAVDWRDYTTAPNNVDEPAGDDVEIGIGDGTTIQFALKKFYQSGAQIVPRNIRLPQADTVIVWVDDVLQVEGVDYTVNDTTGMVTFGAAPTLGQVITAGCKFDVRVRFGEEIDRLFDITQEDFDQNSIPQIVLVEGIEGEPQDDEYPYGGSNKQSFGTNISISIAQGRVHQLTPTTSGLKVILDDDPTTVPDGGVHLWIKNKGANSFNVEYPANTALATVPAGEGVAVCIGDDGAASYEWVLFAC